MEAARISKMSVYIKDICSFVQKKYVSYFLHINACLLQLIIAYSLITVNSRWIIARAVVEPGWRSGALLCAAALTWHFS
jgi:argininosuccinate synthase